VSATAQKRTETRINGRRDEEIIRLVTGLLQQYEPPRVQCWACIERGHKWMLTHAQEWEQAQEAARSAAPQGQPVPSGAVVQHLPEPLRPDPQNPLATGTDRIPASYHAVTWHYGTPYCTLDAEQLIDQHAEAERQAALSMADALMEGVRAGQSTA
jgi:hypothetical protein